MSLELEYCCNRKEVCIKKYQKMETNIVYFLFDINLLIIDVPYYQRKNSVQFSWTTFIFLLLLLRCTSLQILPLTKNHSDLAPNRCRNQVDTTETAPLPTLGLVIHTFSCPDHLENIPFRIDSTNWLLGQKMPISLMDHVYICMNISRSLEIHVFVWSKFAHHCIAS